MEGGGLRLFIALPVSEEVKEKAGELMRDLKAQDTDIKWVTPANLHLTVKFLGDTEKSRLPKIAASLDQIATTYDPFYITIHGTGTFPEKGNPRIIWIGADSAGKVQHLRDNIESSMESLGYHREKRAYHPHLTIGRIRSRRGMKRLLAHMGKYSALHFGIVPVDSIELMKSDLKPQGAVYTCLHAAPMKKTSGG